MPPTAQQILDAIDQAVYDLTVGGAAEVQVNGKVFRAHNLSTLKETRTYYANLVASQSGGALARAVGGIPTRS